MALKIVRATSDASETRPLRLWLQGREAEALERLADPAGGELADDAAQLVTLALQGGERHARALGAALASLGRRRRRLPDPEGGLRGADRRGEHRPAARPAGRRARWRCSSSSGPWLQRRPAEPVLLNYVGVALYGLNEASLAVRVLEAAERLDPNLENLAGNLAAAKQRLRRPVNVTLPPRERQAVNGLRAFLKDVGRRAATATDDVRVSLCMIVKDEEEMLPECLASCADGVDEMIIVDTGSSDRTSRSPSRIGATRAALPVERLVLRRPQPRHRRRHRHAHPLARRRRAARGRATPRSCAHSPRSRTARRTGWSRPTSPARRRSAPPRTTSPYGSGATGRRTASAARSTSRSASRCRSTCRSGSRSRSCGSGTTAT